MGDRSEAVADELWDRVLTMAARAAALEQAEALGELDEEGRGRLAALRLRCSRATARARLADDIADRFADELHVTVLVDFENDSVRTALEVADALGPRLWGVRLDTSSTMVDRSLWHEMGRFRPTGVVPELVWKVRNALDDAGHGRVRIVASGGFDARRIREFEDAGVPVDAYGVGPSLLQGSNDFTADVVRVNGAACAKVGREERPNPRLEPVA